MPSTEGIINRLDSPSKRWLTYNGLQAPISQKREFVLSTAVGTSGHTFVFVLIIL
jgi:hypothetical protein